MANKDKVQVAFTLESLVAEDAQANETHEPLVIGVGGNSTITFGDPSSLGIFTLLDLQDGENGDVLAVLKGILSEEDFDKLREVNPSGRVLGSLMEKVTTYYAGSVGADKS